MKTYTIAVKVCVKARSFESAVQKLEFIGRRKAVENVVGYEYLGAVKR